MVQFAHFGKREKHPWQACNVINSNTPPWVFFNFLKLCEWYQIAQSVSHESGEFHAVPHTNSKSNQSIIITKGCRKL